MIKVIFEDDYLLAVDKKANLLTVPSPKQKNRTLTDYVSAYLSKKNQEAFACHRLDKETSGLIIYAKSKDIQKAIMEQFKARVIQKGYFAVVQGNIKKQRQVIRGAVQPRGKSPKFAVTRVRVRYWAGKFIPLEKVSDKAGGSYSGEDSRSMPPPGNTVRERSSPTGFTILDIEPKTGRTNQIRIHLSRIGHPVIGERKYTIAKRWPVKFRRACLHAYSLRFRHPVSRDTVSLKIGLPSDIQRFLDNHQINIRI